MRLDEALIARGLTSTRSRARDQINRGCVTVDGAPARKPSQNVTGANRIEIRDAAAAYVSRSALKLVHALDHFKVSPEGRNCLDVGASTGGFTQVLLERGAAHVTAIDVGHGQLAELIANNPHVTSLEGFNARDFTPDANISLIVCDVSFISLRQALPKILQGVGTGCVMVALIKPQFEVGRERLPKDGIVKDTDLHQSVCTDISRFVQTAGWDVLGIVASPIEGGDGNIEFLIAATKL